MYHGSTLSSMGKALPRIKLLCLLIVAACLAATLSSPPLHAQTRTGPKVLIFTEPNTYWANPVRDKILRYKADLQAIGYNAIDIELFNESDLTADIKGHIAQYNPVGCVFIGKLPVKMFEQAMPGGSIIDRYPTDWFFSDLDGTWADEQQSAPYQAGCYDGYEPTGNPGPDIIFSRIDTSNVQISGRPFPSYELELELLADYLDKLHDFYTGQMTRTYKGLSYHGDADVGTAYPDYDALSDSSATAAVYINALNSGQYEFVCVKAHSSPIQHCFGGEICGACPLGAFFNVDALALTNGPIFYSLRACKAIRYTEPSCLGDAYIFNGTRSLMTVGGTTDTAPNWEPQLFEGLVKHRSIGAAFLAGCKMHPTEKYFVMRGDPFLIPFPRMHVSPDGDDSNSGYMWSSAKRTIAGALAALPANMPHKEVWVAEGTYTENVTIPYTVKIVGGFVGTEDDIEDREVSLHPTIISAGDGNAISITNLSAATSVLDGLTITHQTGTTGRGISCTGSDLAMVNCTITGNSNNDGAGICGSNSTLSISGCGISGNTAILGGGIKLQSCTATVENSSISGNVASGQEGPFGHQIGSGGGLYASQSTLALHGNTLAANTAAQVGGGAYVEYCSGVVDGNTFSQNAAISCGGGLFLSDAAMPVTGSTFTGNTGNSGSGMLIQGNQSGNVTSNTFTGNTGGTALCCDTDYSGTVSGCTVTGNQSGGIFCLACSPTITLNTVSGNGGASGIGCMWASPSIVNNIVSGNTAGGISCDDSCAPVIANNTIVDNTGTQGGVYSAGCNPTVKNNIIAFNSKGVYGDVNSTVTLTNNDVYCLADNDEYIGVSAGSGDISADPQFANRAGGDFHLLNTSPCIDAGINTGAPAMDFEGTARPVDGNGDGNAVTDMGIFEAHGLYVNVNSSGPFNGRSWATAYRTIQEAVNAAHNGEEIWVAGGTYNERVAMRDTVRVYGGFNGTENSRSQRNVAANETIIAGGTTSEAVLFDSCGDQTVLDGLTLTNGNANGRGAKFVGGAPILTNCKVAGNLGGGILCTSQAAPLIALNVIAGNHATDGAGIYVEGGSQPVISRNKISGNEASDEAGAIYCIHSAASIVNNLITGNTAVVTGGIYCEANPLLVQPVRIVNNTICDNVASDVLGGITLNWCPVLIQNNVIANNIWGIYVAGPYVEMGPPVLMNNNVYGQGVNNYDGIQPGVGDISQNPLFVDSANGNYQLQSSSPCIDAGASNEWSPSDDFAGATRPYDGDGNGSALYDIGTYERH